MNRNCPHGSFALASPAALRVDALVTVTKKGLYGISGNCQEAIC